MSLLAPTLQAFFAERLIAQRQVSPNTIASYRDTIRLLLTFAQEQTGRAPSRLRLEDLDAPLVNAFLEHLERERGCSARTRNTRLSALRSLFAFAALRHPEHAALIARVLAIPPKRTDKPLITFLTEPEAEALLASPDQSRWLGRRDHALLLVAIQTGLRVSELAGLCCHDVSLTRPAHVRCHGKGRKERVTPLTQQTVRVLRAWLIERGRAPEQPLFPTIRGGRLSRDAIERLLTKYLRVAEENCPSLRAKRLSPHALRHTSAMRLLHAGVDTAVIALWLGHEDTRTTQIYLHADLALKERALARTAPPQTTTARYRAPDTLLAFLQKL